MRRLYLLKSLRDGCCPFLYSTLECELSVYADVAFMETEELLLCLKSVFSDRLRGRHLQVDTHVQNALLQPLRVKTAQLTGFPETSRCPLRIWLGFKSGLLSCDVCMHYT